MYSLINNDILADNYDFLDYKRLKSLKFICTYYLRDVKSPLDNLFIKKQN